MGHKNYTKYSENSEQVVNNEVQVNEADVVNVTPVNEIPEDEKVVDGVNIITEVEKPEEPEEPEVKHAEGTVVGCSRLNVRKEPNTDAKVIRIFNKGDFVAVDLENSTEDFYKVSTPSGEGYCMKNFIEIK